ncbi:hypothetical protein [Pseudomonas mosselii]|uniref:hypothetical protein n=1 Tax=Pseudomonas mosselii TaxID=78327 RepID=UPI003F2D6F91
MDTNKMRDISREQFEAVFSEKCPLTFAAAKAGESKAHGDMSVAWWGWQASREALTVELPSASAYEGLTQHLGCVIELTYQKPEHDPVELVRLPDVVVAIEACGLKVKP